MKPKKFTVAKMAQALRNCNGLKSQAARALGCSCQTVCNYINDNDELSEVYEEVLGANVDNAESQLRALIDERNPTAIIFFLKCKGGYVERHGHEVSGPNGGPVRVQSIEELTDEQLATIALRAEEGE